MKKIFLILSLISYNFLYSIDYKEFIKNNKIEIVIRKIPFIQKNEKNKSYKYPFDEYYFTSGEKLLKVTYSAIKESKDEDGKLINNGFFTRNNTEISLSKPEQKIVNKIIEIGNNLNLEKDKVTVHSDRFYLLEPGEYTKKKMKGMIKRTGFYINNQKEINIEFEILYVVELRMRNLVFMVASDETLYSKNSENIEQFIVLINELIIQKKYDR